MAQQYRLLARAELNGALRDPGYVFELATDADGKEIPGPHRSVVASNHGAQIADHIGADNNGLVDVPLYEAIKDDPATPQDESKGEKSPEQLAAELEQANGHIGTLEAEIADKNLQIEEAHARLKAIYDILDLPREMIVDQPAGGPLLLDKPEGGTKAPAHG